MGLAMRGFGVLHVAAAVTAVAVGCALPGYSVGESTATGTTSATSGSGGAGVGGAGVGGAGGGEVACVDPTTDCPLPLALCMNAVCKEGVCATEPVMDGESPRLTPFNKPGDCARYECVEGKPTRVADNMDVPKFEGPCSSRQCEGGEIIFVKEQDGAPCDSLLHPKGTCVQGECHECAQNGMVTSCEDPLSMCSSTFECAAPHCNNQMIDPNLGETSTDCGGPCPGCPVGKPCEAHGDCASKVCDSKICKQPACPDGVKNGSETDVDCGGLDNFCQLACDPGMRCVKNEDCTSLVCHNEICQEPACGDGVQNGDELMKDCGGPLCPPCAP